MCIQTLPYCNINCIASYKLFPSSMDYSDLFAQSVCTYLMSHGKKKQAQKEAEHHNESDQREVKDDHVDHLTGEVLYQVPQPIPGRHEREVLEPYSTYFLRFRFSSSCNRTTHIYISK